MSCRPRMLYFLLATQAASTEVDSTPAAVREAKAEAFRHATLGPRGEPPTPDPRLLGWTVPKTNKEPRTVCLAYSTTRQVRQTYLAGEWAEHPSGGGGPALGSHAMPPCMTPCMTYDTMHDIW